MTEDRFMALPLKRRIQMLYFSGTFVVSIRYYGYKVNLYLMHGGYYVEAFYNHKLDCIERIEPLDRTHTRMKFYADQINLPEGII